MMLMIRSRKSSGTMLILVIFTMAIIVAVSSGIFAYNWFLFQYAQAQSKGDELAASLASVINAGDRVGQINDLEECSRELVYTSRDAYEKCDQEGLQFLDSLCYQLVDEARSGQSLVEQERKNQIHLITSELSDAATKYNSSSAANSNFNFLGLRTSEPRIEGIAVGYVRTTESNVKTLDTIMELANFDRQRDYIDNASKLYRANINARLPEDTDLSYNLSSLPACVDGSCAPARNANPDAFMQTSTIFGNGHGLPKSYPDQIPTGVQVYYSMDVCLGRNLRGIIDLSSTGITNGALAGSN